MPFKKGYTPWNKGKPNPGAFLHTRYDCTGLTGDKHPKWKGGKPYRDNRQREYLRKIRNATLEALGGVCKECGFSDKRALQIDHVNGGGSKERKERGFSKNFHKHVLESFLKGEGRYQLLCANCNWIKRFENKEATGKFGVGGKSVV